MPHPVDVHVGRRLREMRERAGMPQKALAARLGLSFQQVQKYESGANRISASKMWELCGIFRAEPGYFFEGLERGPKSRKKLATRQRSSPPRDGRHARQILDLNNYFQKIKSADIRRQIVQLVKSLAA